jgi:hypothetical protein
MRKRRLAGTILALFAALIVFAATGHALAVNHENRLTFNQPVALPGVVLPAGTYSFDVASPTALDVVVVRNVGRTKTFYMGFTKNVSRPSGMSTAASIVFAEAPATQPRPISRWYEIGTMAGHEFAW